jgi:hypothetical protein
MKLLWLRSRALRQDEQRGNPLDNPSVSLNSRANWEWQAMQAYSRPYLAQFLAGPFTDTGMLKSTPACRFVSSVACRSIVFSGISRVRPAAASSNT